jgi:hypothetical protein
MIVSIPDCSSSIILLITGQKKRVINKTQKSAFGEESESVNTKSGLLSHD